MKMVTMLVAMLMTATSAAVAAAAAAAPPALRYRFAAGDLWRYAVVVDSRMGMAGEKGESRLTWRAEFDVNWRVAEVKPDGSAVMRVGVERFAFAADSPMLGGKVVVKSGDAPPDAKPAKFVHAALAAMADGEATAVVTPAGEVREFRWHAAAADAFASQVTLELAGFFGEAFYADGARRYLAAPIARLPDQAAEAGVEWVEWGGGLFRAKQKSTHRVTSADADAVTWDAAVEIDGRDDGDAFVPTGKGAGQVRFDRKAGRVRSARREVRLDGFEERIEVRQRAADEK